ncbi:MAG: ABC transporter permease subunit [Bacteroidales bacterium]|jgi:NitT/TauT family transport system permease protein|nr:ABC transporter permease subunit [Bacteroidales bacterium]
MFKRNKIIENIFRFLFAIILIVLFWEVLRFFCIRLFDIQKVFFPSTSEILNTLYNYLLDINFWIPFGNTLVKITISFLVVLMLSFAIGTFLGYKSKVYSLFRPFWDFLRSIPPATLFPIFLILIGLGDSTKVIIAIYFATLILSLNIADSLRHVIDNQNNIWENMKINKNDIFKFYLIPQIINYLFSGLRITGSLIVALIVIAEMYVGTESGVGGAIVSARDQYDWNKLYAFIVVTGFMGYFINQLIDLLYSKFKTNE